MKRKRNLGSSRSSHAVSAKIMIDDMWSAARQAVGLLTDVPMQPDTCRRAETQIRDMEMYRGGVLHAMDSATPDRLRNPFAADDIKYAWQNAAETMHKARELFASRCRISSR